VNLVLRGVDWHLHAADLQRGELPQRGNRVSVHGSLARDTGKGATGEFHATSIFMDTPLGHGSFTGAVLEIHNFTMEDGTLVGIGKAAAGAKGVFTVVGGSGRYQGATGSYAAQQSPLETGGDGTALFEFSLLLGG
jgi:hypothetical protein